ncbi:MAG: hypothetical protein ACREMQ_21525 [Longimicrobiales bacterium]
MLEAVRPALLVRAHRALDLTANVRELLHDSQAAPLTGCEFRM